MLKWIVLLLGVLLLAALSVPVFVTIVENRQALRLELGRLERDHITRLSDQSHRRKGFLAEAGLYSHRSTTSGSVRAARRAGR